MASQQEINAVVAEATKLGYSPDEVNQALKKKGLFSESLNQTYSAEEKSGKDLGFLGTMSNLVGSTKLGQYIGGKASIGGQPDRAQTSSIGSINETMQDLDARINNNRAIGRDTTRLEQAKRELSASLQQAEFDQSQTRSGGGVTGKQAVGSAIQTAASAIPFTSALSKVPAARGLTGITSRSPMALNAVEGALGGAAYGLGSAIEEDKSFGETIGSTILGGIGGGIAGPVVGKALNLGSKAFGKVANIVSPELAQKGSKALGQVGDVLNMDIKKLQTSVLKNISNSADNFTKNPNLRLKEFFGENGDPTKSSLFQGVETVYNRAAGDAIQVPTYDKKTKTLTTKAFDPMSDGPLESSVAFNKMRRDAFIERNTALTEVPDEFFQNKKAELLSELRNKQSKYLSGEQKNAINTYIKDIENISNLADLNTYNYDVLGSKTKSKMATAADNTSAEIAQDVKKIAESKIDDSLNSFMGKEDLANLKAQVEYLTAMENIANENISKLAPDISLKDLNLYGASNMLSGGFFGNPAQLAKGTAFTALSNIVRGKNKFSNFNKAIKDMDALYKQLGITPEYKPFDIAGFKSDVTAKTAPKALPAGGEARRTIPTGETIPVAPRGSNIDITSPQGVNYGVDDVVKAFPEDKQAEAKVLLDKLKKLQGGFSNSGALVAIASLLGGATILGNTSNKQTFINNVEDGKVSLAKNKLDIDALKTEIAYRESRGEEEPYSAINENKDGTTDYGKYQVNKETLDHWSERALGKKYSVKEFLNSPEAQEKFFEYVMDRFSTEYEVSDPELAMALWHKGWSPKNINKDPKELKKEAEEYLLNK